MVTFNDVWPTLPIPGEFDAMDACDQARWRGVIEMAFEAGANRPALKWSPAPLRTQWGAGMQVASIALSKDATLDLYAHTNDLHLVAAALRAIAC